MFRICALLFSVTLLGCATAPSWVETGETAKITWHKDQIGASYVSGGVCHLFAPNTRETLAILGEQVKACFGRTLSERSDTPRDIATKVVTIMWHKVPQDRLAQRNIELSGMPRPGSIEKALLQDIGGFFFNRSDLCHIVVPDAALSIYSLGHETKHCFDSYFHDHYGNWRR